MQKPLKLYVFPPYDSIRGLHMTWSSFLGRLLASLEGHPGMPKLVELFKAAETTFGPDALNPTREEWEQMKEVWEVGHAYFKQYGDVSP
jgi:hypothetical protein